MYHHKDGTVVIPTNHLRRQTEDPAAKWVITDDMNFEPKVVKEEQKAKITKEIQNKVSKRKEQVDESDNNDKRKKLTEEDVRDIRRLNEEGMSYSILAEGYKVSNACIRNIVLRNTWKHVE